MRKNKVLFQLLASALLAVGLMGGAQAQVRITEWMYSGVNGEFIEFTNFGSSAVNFAGWSFDDDSQVAGVFDLSALGSVSAGQSVVITESEAGAFSTAWSLAASVKVLGGLTANLGRNDQINLFNGMTLVDRLTFGDQTFAGTIRTQNKSGVAQTFAALGSNDATLWQLSVVGDLEKSYASAGGDIGNPGFTSFAAAVPEPETYALLLAGLGLMGAVVRRKKARTA